MNLSRERFKAALARIFTGLGAEAIYRPASGGAINLRAVPRVVDVQSLDPFAPAEQTGRVMSLLVDNVPARPTKGASVEILAGGRAMPGVYPVLEEATSTDVFQLVWRCRVGEPA